MAAPARQSGDEKQQASVTARITLGHIAKKGHTKWEYIAKAGSITWDASGSDTFCTWKSAGSRRANQYDLYLMIEGAGPYRAGVLGTGLDGTYPRPRPASSTTRAAPRRA